MDEGVRRKGEQEAAGRISEQSPNHHERAKPKFPSGDVTAQKTSTCAPLQLEMPVPACPIGSVLSPCLVQRFGLYFIRLLCPWDFLGKETGVDCHFLLQGIFPAQELNLCLRHWPAGSLPLSHVGSSRCVVKYSFFSFCSWLLGGTEIKEDIWLILSYARTICFYYKQLSNKLN